MPTAGYGDSVAGGGVWTGDQTRVTVTGMLPRVALE